MRTCKTCGRQLPATTEFFHQNGWKYADGTSGLRPHCKECMKQVRDARPRVPTYAKTKAWRHANPENWRRTLQHNKDWRKRNPEKQRLVSLRQHLKRQGWTYEMWQAAMEEQQGVCAIDGCERLAECADHCHTSGRARRLICGSCNKALGLIYDNPLVARGLAIYLEAHRGEGQG